MEDIFNAYFSSGKNSIRYGFNVDRFDNAELVATLTFYSNETYCCAEATCHLKLDWQKIRSLAEKEGVTLPKPMTLQLSVIVEKGAKIETNKCISKSLESEGYTYADQFNEKT